MRFLSSVAVLLAFALAALGGEFTVGMSPAEQGAAGLAKLSPAELDARKAAVERYKSGGIDAVRLEERRKGYFASLFESGDRNDFTITSTLPGEYRAFCGRPVFQWENGQRGMAAEALNYSAPKKLTDPTVTITPGSLGTFWLHVEGGPRVRINPVPAG